MARSVNINDCLLICVYVSSIFGNLTFPETFSIKLPGIFEVHLFFSNMSAFLSSSYGEKVKKKNAVS